MKSKAEIDKFEKTNEQLKALHGEIGILSKKKPDDAINKFKLQFVNNVLKNANELLGKQYKPFSEFDLFDKDDIPTNSDVIMILAQYLNCMEKLRSDNIFNKGGCYYWLIKDETTDFRTSRPKKLKE
ncbi:MAG: hypothetical protein FVQ85_19935 [Planctomycetes bacterium]|nr:hypothetical protein [Planctomycetota bacterium]